MKTSVNLFLLGLLLHFNLLAQDPLKGKVSGEILDENKKGLPYATVMILNPTDSSLVKGEITGPDGKYTIEGIFEGKFIFSSSILGYQKFYSEEISIDAHHLKIQLPSIQMVPEIHNLKEVTIVGQKPFIEQKIDRTVINVENSVVASGGTALEVLQRSPGVFIDKDDRISLRGKQGVIIMIDGKVSNLSAEDAANMLRNMPSNSIESIELITNPSAKYDASGNAGIINIKLKKNSKAGMNGSIDVGTGYGRFEKYNAGLNLNYRNNKINLFGNYNYSYNKRFSSNVFKRDLGKSDETRHIHQDNFRPMLFENHTYKFGVDYNLDKKSTIGLMINGFLTYGGIDVQNTTLYQDRIYRVDSSLAMTNNIDNRWSSNAYNLNYKANLDTLGRELSVDFDYSKYTGQALDDLNTRYFDVNNNEYGLPMILRSDIPSVVDIKSGKIDYVHPLTKASKFEAGLKTSFVTTDNDVKWETFKEGNWGIDYTKTNHFKYRENINAAYLNLNTSYKDFSIQLGLRGEHTDAEGRSITNDSTVSRNYINLFPSAFVNQKLSEKHLLGYSYSRRIDRPNYQNLNPFIYFLDPNTYFQGNPFLKPQYTHSLQLTHTFNGKIITTLGYSNTKGAFSQILQTVDSTKIKATMMNLDSYNNYSLGFNAPFPITKWWNTNNNLNIYFKEYASDNLEQKLSTSGMAWTLNTNHNITLPKDFSAEVSGMYLSPNIDGIITIKSMYVISAGLQKSFWNKKASVKLNVNDVFNMMKFRGTIVNKGETININGNWESRYARLTFSYRFGKEDIKPARRRSSGSESEQNRIKMEGN